MASRVEGGTENPSASFTGCKCISFPLYTLLLCVPQLLALPQGVVTKVLSILVSNREPCRWSQLKRSNLWPLRCWSHSACLCSVVASGWETLMAQAIEVSRADVSVASLAYLMSLAHRGLSTCPYRTHRMPIRGSKRICVPEMKLDRTDARSVCGDRAPSRTASEDLNYAFL